MEKEIKKEEQSQKADIPRETKEALELAERERDEYLNGWKRAKADLLNFKRETQERISGLSGALKADCLKSFLPLADALDEAAKNNIEGLENVRSLLKGILEGQGVKEITTSVGEKFNPELHEAIEGEGDTIDEILQTGYQTEDILLRPVKVKVKN